MKTCCLKNKKKTKEKKGCGLPGVLLGNAVRILLIWCAVQSVYKTIEANKEAKARAEKRSQEQEWEFDRVYPEK